MNALWRSAPSSLKLRNYSYGDDLQDAKDTDAITVWLVEDDSRFRQTVRRLLNAAAGIMCEYAFSCGEEALETLETAFAPEVVLMDIGLPGMSGIECVRALRAISPGTHIIMLTVHEDDEQIFEAVCNGASGYLLKPSSADVILEAIRSVRIGGAPINPMIAGRILEMFAQLAVPRGDYGLTSREREILHHLVEGKTQKQIAVDLFLSAHTVGIHIRNIYAKLHVHSRSGAVAKALKERLI